eukprot:3391876-Amphidinium_carterae.1
MLSRMISETSVPSPHEEPRGLRHERQKMLEDMNEPQHMPTIHENAKVDPLTLDDPWSRFRTSNHAAFASMKNDLSRSRTRHFHEKDRRGYGSGCPFPMSTTSYNIHTPQDDTPLP